MRVLIFGATGLIGSAVMRAAIAAGHETVAVTRNAKRAKALRAAGAQPVVGDMTKPETWDAAVATSDAVIHVAAAFEGDLAAADDIWTGAMEALARAGRSPKRIVYTGGCWLYPERSEPPITEADAFDPLPPFEYMRVHRDRLRAAGLDVVTLHPGLVWSDTAGCTAEIGAAVAGQQPVEIVGSPETLWPLVHADDLARLYIDALRPDAACTDILAVSDPAVSVTNIIAAAEQAYGMHASLHTLPVAEAVRRYGPWVAGKARSQRIEGARAELLLGWRPEHHFPAQGLGAIASPRSGACEPETASADQFGAGVAPDTNDPGRRYRVIADWTATYCDRIRLAKGDPLELTGRTECWDGHLWVWARSRDGREGWLPDSLVVAGGGGEHLGARAREAYSATELDCLAGQVLIGSAEVSGWVWCRGPDGTEGWVPARNLAAVDS